MSPVFTKDYEKQFMLEIDNAVIRSKLQVVNLGGVSGSSGGSGAPPGGFLGKLAQRYVTFDSTEATSSGYPPSPSLVDNLNRIRGGWALGDGSILLRHLGVDITGKFHPGNTAIVASSGGDFTTIQEGIDYVNGLGGGLVLIYPGIYLENLTLYPNVYLYALTNVSILPTSGVTVTLPSSGNVELIGANFYGANNQAVIVYPSGSTAIIGITNCRITTSGTGLGIDGSTSNGQLSLINSTVGTGDISAPPIITIRDGVLNGGIIFTSPGGFTGLPKIKGTVTGTYSGLYQNIDGKIKGPGFIFTSLEDVPASYVDQKLKVPRVKFDETGLEFVVSSGSGGTGSITGTSGTINRAIIVASGTGGSMIQGSLPTIDMDGSIDLPINQTYKVNGSLHTHPPSGVYGAGNVTAIPKFITTSVLGNSGLTDNGIVGGRIELAASLSGDHAQEFIDSDGRFVLGDGVINTLPLWNSSTPTTLTYLANASGYLKNNGQGSISWDETGYEGVYGSYYGYGTLETQNNPSAGIWYEINSGLTAGNLNFVTYNAGILSTTLSGKYLINWSMTVNLDTSDEEIQGGILIGGDEISQGRSNGGNMSVKTGFTLASTAIVSITDTQDISIGFRSLAGFTGTITISSANLTITRVGT